MAKPTHSKLSKTSSSSGSHDTSKSDRSSTKRLKGSASASLASTALNSDTESVAILDKAASPDDDNAISVLSDSVSDTETDPEKALGRLISLNTADSN
jgi:hypothetical protein